METKTASNFWWLKTPTKPSLTQETGDNATKTVPRLELDISSSLADFLEKEQNALNSNKDDYTDVDVGSIIDEINRVAAQSPLGPFEPNTEERSIEDIMKEAERIYMESSKSFEQLSQRSKTSQNITDLNSSLSKDSTPTPKSVSPLPLDPENGHNSDSESEYSTDFTDNSKMESIPSPIVNNKASEKIDSDKAEEEVYKDALVDNYSSLNGNSDSNSVHTAKESAQELPEKRNTVVNETNETFIYNKKMQETEQIKFVETHRHSVIEKDITQPNVESENIKKYKEAISYKEDLIKTLEEDNKLLKNDIRDMKLQLQETNRLLEQTRLALNSKSISSPEINLELEKALEDLKDSREINTALQLQLDGMNKTHVLLKNSYDDLINSNSNLERKVLDLDATLNKYKTELLNVQRVKDKLLENEASITKLLEIEKIQSKSLKLQNEKDAKCIQDLNRQIKEMERIIARKHPDSVSALIVAAKNDATDSNLTARKVLEDRIKILEQEASNRDNKSSKVFLDIQEKFNQMKLKYESHIEDLELHVSDLKNQLKRKSDTYDVYTQTSCFDEQKIPQKDTFTISTQTDQIVQTKTVVKSAPTVKRVAEKEVKEETHLIATIRGLQADLSNKEKVLNRLQRDMDELRKTNRRLQKEREGSLRNLSDKKEFRSYPEKLANQISKSSSGSVCSGDLEVNRSDEELKLVKNERDKLKQQLCRLEEDYQTLKNKRLQDLNALQEAHEREIAVYVSNVTPLREQLEVQQVTISTLQSQLSAAKEELSIVTVERDHLNNRLLTNSANAPCNRNVTSMQDAVNDNNQVDSLVKKIAVLEQRYEDREHRLRAIVHGLAQKNVTNRSCEQCAARQQQLIGYKVELDQLLATLRALQ